MANRRGITRAEARQIVLLATGNRAAVSRWPRIRCYSVVSFTQRRTKSAHGIGSSLAEAVGKYIAACRSQQGGDADA